MNRLWSSLIGAVALSQLLFGCGSEQRANYLKVGATAVPHAEILEQIKSDLHKQGIDLDIIVVDDYNTPNRALADGDLDANFFQHPQFLELQSREFGYQLEILAKVHIEPMGLYSHKIKALSQLPKNAAIAIPNDPTNQARALLLLEHAGLISLDRHDVQTSLLNISENALQIHFLEIDAPLLSRILEDVDLAAINANFALQAGLSPQTDALLLEAVDSPYINIVVIRKGEGQREELMALKKALNSEHLRQFIDKHYRGAVIKINE